MLKRKYLPLLVCFVLLFLSAFSAHAGDDIKACRECNSCGMDRKVYGYSRMLIVFYDGAELGVCSLHCAVTKLNELKNRKVKNLLVADRDTQQLVEAEKAIWTIGGKKRGVMTQRPKWAFATKEAAKAFTAANGGTIVTWQETLAAAHEDVAPPRTSQNIYQLLSKPGEKNQLGTDHYFIFGFDKQPKIGVAIMRAEVFSRDGKRDTSFVVKGDADMPSMRGAHSSGDKDFSLSAKGVYLLPVRLVMPGDWEVRFTFVKKGTAVLRGAYLFDV
jgi:nitrous oxide reductase accessory protein NosL